ncbi:MAG: HD-GYP domain-containing protein [Clostridiales bacterium]|nr:HD-GYP domain-containing protein [Clostridiales bacterium]
MSKSKIKEVSIEDLKKGMKLAKDVISQRGNILLPKGQKLEEIQRTQMFLEQHNIYFVFVEEAKTNVTAGIEPKTELEKEEEEIELFREEYMQVRNSMEKDFRKILQGEKIEKKEVHDNLDKILEAFGHTMNVFQLMQRMEELDDITYAHSYNVTLISYSIGKWLKLSKKQLEELTMASMLLDIGKVKVDGKILNKSENFTNDDLLECKKHVIYSYEAVKNYDFISQDVKQAILMHHERMDGSGYPLAVKGDKIPLFARIIAIADIYSAITSARPYREKKTPFQAISILEKDYVQKLDTKILYHFMHRIGSCFVGQQIELSNGKFARIIFIPSHNIYRPVVKLDNTEEIIDLSSRENKDIEIVNF